MCVVIVNFGCKKLLLLIYAGAFAPAIFTTEERGINMLDLLKSITSIFLTVLASGDPNHFSSGDFDQ